MGAWFGIFESYVERQGDGSMKEIADAGMLNVYMTKNQIESLFETKQLPFRLCEYDRGEILNNIRDSGSCLQFVVAGEVQIYAVRSDGSRYPLCYLDGFTVLGDMEFCGEDHLPFLVEAVRKVHCIELPLYGCRAALWNDNTFLRYLLRSVSHKLALVSRQDAEYSTLEEKLLHYLRQECPGGQMHGVEHAATHLHCSRRQLQRLLRSLSDRQVIEKIGKGIYRLLIFGVCLLAVQNVSW